MEKLLNWGVKPCRKSARRTAASRDWLRGWLQRTAKGQVHLAQSLLGCSPALSTHVSVVVQHLTQLFERKFSGWHWSSTNVRSTSQVRMGRYDISVHCYSQFLHMKERCSDDSLKVLLFPRSEFFFSFTSFMEPGAIYRCPAPAAAGRRQQYQLLAARLVATCCCLAN